MDQNFRSSGGSRKHGGFKNYRKPKVPAESSTLTLSHTCDYNDTTNYNPLFLAVHNGKLNITHSLLEESSLVEEVSGRKLIHIAAARGHEEVIHLLGKRNAQINEGDKDGNTPLHLAIKANHTDAVNLLLNEVTANLKNLREATPLHIATDICNSLFVDLLLKSGANVDEQDEDGKTPLHISAEKPNPNLEIIMFLLTHGASVHASCKNGLTPLHYVTTSGNVNVTEVLIDRGACTTLEDISGVSPLCLAIQKNSTEMVKYILKKRTVIDFVITGKMMPLHFAAQTGNEEIVKLLLTDGIADKVNARDKDMYRPLHFSAANGHIKVSKYLIECGAEIDPQTTEGNAPLHLAAAAGNIEIVTVLLDRGAEIDRFNTEGFTPLTVATKARKTDVVRLLLNKGASSTHCRRTRKYSSGLELGRRKSAMDVIPAFHVAAKIGDEEIIKIFLTSGIEVDLKSKNDKTALHFAATCGHKKVVEELIKAGADINSHTKFFETPLHLAAASGRSSIVKYLLDSGAEIRITCGNYTPLHYALDRERHDAVINHKKPISFSNEVLVTPFRFEKYLQITEMLLIKGTCLERETADGDSPLNLAFKIRVSKCDQSKHSSNSLGEVNASERRKENGEFRPEIVRCLLNYGAEMNFCDSFLKRANESKCSPFTAFLLEHDYIDSCDYVNSLNLAKEKCAKNNFSRGNSLDDSWLSKAINLKCLSLVDILLEYDINDSFNYQNALNLAQETGDLNIIIAITEKISDIETIVNAIYSVDIFRIAVLRTFTSSEKLLRKDIVKLLIAIIVKMRSTSKIANIVQTRELKLLEREELTKWYTQCELEVMNMRERKIHQQSDITFYDMLTCPVSKLASYARNKNFMQMLESGTCKQFAAFAPCLERSIQKGKERKDLIEWSTECFFNLIRQYCKIQLPSLIVDKVFEYLSVTDLRKLSATIHKKCYHYDRSSYGFRADKRN